MEQIPAQRRMWRRVGRKTTATTENEKTKLDPQEKKKKTSQEK